MRNLKASEDRESGGDFSKTLSTPKFHPGDYSIEIALRMFFQILTNTPRLTDILRGFHAF